MNERLDLSAIVLSDRHPIRSFLDDVVEIESVGARTDGAVVPPSDLAALRQPSLVRNGPVAHGRGGGRPTRIPLGTQVASPNFRHPVMFAKELMTLDNISGGRIEAGVGAGSNGPDAVVLGDAPVTGRARFARFAEWLDLLDRLLREPVVTAAGEWYVANNAHQIPGCLQVPRVPLTVAATGFRGLALAVR